MIGTVIDFRVGTESKVGTASENKYHLNATIRNTKGERRTFKFKLHDTPFFTELYSNPGEVQIIATDTEGFSVVTRYSN